MGPVEIAELIRSGAVARRVSLTPDLRAGEWNTLFECEGAGVITHIWFTFPTGDKDLGRRNLLRMRWDGEESPSVESPLSDFFGLPFGFTGAEFKISSEYIVVAPNNGLNCYFPMPFARKARIEIFPEQIESGGGFYFQADHYKFPGSLPPQYREQRFHAQWRFENPAENYGRNYLFLDATGKGALVGATFGVEMNQPQPDSWYHGGGDSVFIDGEDAPSVLHGIGAEDFFGHSWGTKEFQSRYIGTTYEGKDLYGHLQRIALYRFFAPDAIPFRRSIRCVLGALANSYSSVAYWYQAEPHRAFFRAPTADRRMHATKAPYGTYDVEDAGQIEWKLLAPFKIDKANPFSKARPLEKKETGKEHATYELDEPATLPGGNKIAVKWRPQHAHHGFVDFHYVARPATKYIRLQTGVVGYAVACVKSDAEREARMFVGFDDEIFVRVNDKEAFHGGNAEGFEERAFTARLRKGANRILVKLSNYPNTTWRLWAFSFRIER